MNSTILVCRKQHEVESWWPIGPVRSSLHLQLSALSPDAAALDTLYGELRPKVDLLPPYRKCEVDLMEVKSRFRFPPILRHYLVNISRETICLFFAEEFSRGDTLKRRATPFLVSGRASIRKLFGSEYRVIHISNSDMVIVSDDKNGQVVSSLTEDFCKQSYVENVANYLFRVWSNDRLHDLKAKSSGQIDFQSFVKENDGRCRRAGLTGFHVPEKLCGHRRPPKDIVRVLHHCKTLDRFAIIDRDRQDKAAAVIQKAWWTFWLKPGRKGVAILEERFKAFCGVTDV